MQPLKVFTTAFFVAVFVKKVDLDEYEEQLEKKAKRLAKDEKWLHQSIEEQSLFVRPNTDSLKPPEEQLLRHMRLERIKERKMRSISRELAIYFLFALVVFVIGYTTRDYTAFTQTKDIEELFKLNGRPGVDRTNLTLKQVITRFRCSSTL